jgi:hypothetical protein
MSDYWILDNRTAIPRPPEMDFISWAMWFKTADRRVALDIVAGIQVSTVFLGRNHSHSRGANARPILFETMLLTEIDTDLSFDDLGTKRYSTWEEAETGHRAIVEQLRAKLHLTEQP